MMTCRYSELENEGMGPPVKYTGMTWTGFTPADDKVRYGYHIPSNMYAVAGLDRYVGVDDVGMCCPKHLSKYPPRVRWAPLSSFRRNIDRVR